MVEIVLLTGHLETGKTYLARQLAERHDFRLIRTSERIKERGSTEADLKAARTELQNIGRQWDEHTNGKWLFDLVAGEVDIGHNKIVVDQVRNQRQLYHFRSRPDWKVVHVHLWAAKSDLEPKSTEKLRAENISYDVADPIESEEDIQKFKHDADIRINVRRTDHEDTYTRVAARLGLFSDPDRKLVDVVVGGQYGSEGKGHIAAALARNYDVLIRVGGPNAGHTVASESGKYVYHQLPSGSKDCTAKILLGAGMTIDKEKLLVEISDCNIDESRLCIDPQAILIMPTDKEREQEMRSQIGSTGSGSGAAAARRILERTATPPLLARDDSDLRKYTLKREVYRGDTVRELERCFVEGKKILLEGTQGSGLSIFHGEYPHVTSRDTNVAGCLAEAGVSPKRVRRVIMVVRTTPIRVANPDGGEHSSGRIKNETSFEKIAEEAGLDPAKVKGAEKTSTTKRDRRVGWFDWEQFRRACILNSPTDIVLTFADYLDQKNQEARRFEQLTDDTIKFIEELEHVAQAPVSIVNTRFPNVTEQPDLRSMIDRRHWR
jgi:adenylosuccinate synthase